MPSLSSLLVQREAAPMRAVEDAIARQVMHGGDLATNLLEVGAVREDVLLATVAECHDLEAAPGGQLVAPPPEVLRLVPGELALRHGIFPLAFRDADRTLVLATAEPLLPAVVDDLSFALGVELEQRTALHVRIRQAIAAVYGIPLDRRLLRLVARVEGRADPSPSVMPPAAELDAHERDRAEAARLEAGTTALRGPGEGGRRMQRPLSVPAPTFGTGLKNSVVVPPPESPGGYGPSGASRTPVVPGGAPMPVIPPLGALPQVSPRSPELALDPLTPTPEPVGTFASAVPTTTKAADDAAPPGRAARGAQRTRALAGVVRSALRTGSGEINKVGRDVKAPRPPRRKGPFTASMAEEELEQVQGADDVFDVFFAFVSQFLGYAALFVVHGDLAEGRAAAGPGASAAKVTSVGVPLDLPSSFATARERRGPHVARLAADGLDAEIARDLERTERKICLVLPLLVRTRTVGLLYGDDGDEDVALANLGEVIAVSALAGAALERIAMRKKHGPRADLTPIPRPAQPKRSTSRAASLALTGVTPPPARAGGLEALARAVGDRRAEGAAASAEPPPANAKLGASPVAFGSEPPPATAAATREPLPAPQVSPGAESVRTPDLVPQRVTAVSPGGIVQTPDSSEFSSLPGGAKPAAPTLAAAGIVPQAKPKPAIADEDSGENISKALTFYSASEPTPAAPERAPSAAGFVSPDSFADLPSPRPIAGTPAALTGKPVSTTPRAAPPQSASASTVREGPPLRNTQPGLGIPAVGELPPKPQLDLTSLPGREVSPRGAPPLPWPERPGRPRELALDDAFVDSKPIVEIGEPVIGLVVPASGPPARVDRDRPTATARRESDAPEQVEPAPELRANEGAPPGPASPDGAPSGVVARPIRKTDPDLALGVDPPPPGLMVRRPKSGKPLPREEAEDSPGTSAFVDAVNRDSAAAHDRVDRSPVALRARASGRPVGGASEAPAENPRAPLGAERFDLPPRSRPSSSPPAESIIVDVAAEYGALLNRTLEGGPRSQEAFAELVRHGEQAVQVLMAKFPGPLRVDRHRARTQLPAASQCGPLLELIVAVRRSALPFVTVRTSSPDIETRFWATHVLGELRYPEAANALVPRLFDDDVAVRRVARRSAAALVGAGEAGAPILQGLDHMVRSPDQPVPYRALAIETMAEIRTGAMVPPLVAVLTAVPEEVAESARRALLVIARQDFGRDVRRWNEWWSKNGERHRIEWLIDALMHEQPAIRRAAGDELKQLTKEYFGYYDDLPKKERERAHGLYRAWWEKEGRRRFS